MKKLSGAIPALEKFFWVFLFINPFLDILNGVYINLVMNVGILDVKFISTLGVTPSLILRMIMLLIFAAYILIVWDKRSILAAIPIGIAWALSVVSEYVTFGSVQFFADVQYAARFCYNIVLLMVYTRVFSARWGTDGRELLRSLNTVISFTLTVLSLSILISAVAGVGYNTYADRVGYRGSRGFFYAGNDITAVLALLLPINIASLMKSEFAVSKTATVLRALAGGFAANALMLIGSKTAFISVAVNFAVMLLAALAALVKNKDRSPLLGYLLSAAAALAVFAVLMLLSKGALWQSIVNSYAVTDVVMEQEGVEAAMLSGRQFKLSEHLAQFRSGGPLVWLFGMGRGSQTEILEMDVFEVVFYYGLFGVVTFLWLYAKAAIDFFRSFLRKPGIMMLALFVSLGMCAGYLFIAGHILFSVTSGFYFIFVINYSRVYFAQQPEQVLLWKKK